MVTFILFLITFGISVSIENPRNSILWLCSMIVSLFDKISGHDSFFDHCMHGGTRDKSTRWWSYNPRQPHVNLVASLSLQCDGQHQHASWKPIRHGKRIQFPTAEEAKYPFILCQRIAFILKQEAIERGFNFPEDLQQQVQVDGNVGKRQLFASQPRSRILANSNHWFPNSWDTTSWFAMWQMQQHCLTSWIRFRRDPGFVIGKLNRGFVGPKQTEDFPVSMCTRMGGSHGV
jgi:hypothetical protein